LLLFTGLRSLDAVEASHDGKRAAEQAKATPEEDTEEHPEKRCVPEQVFSAFPFCFVLENCANRVFLLMRSNRGIYAENGPKKASSWPASAMSWVKCRIHLRAL
jgi:hypothetical protein